MKTISAGTISLMLLSIGATAALAQQQNTVPIASTAQTNMPDVVGAEPDSQAYPAKYSARNNQLDELPIMAFPVPLTDAQRSRIVEIVKQQNMPVETIAAAPSEVLPYKVEVQKLPEALMAEIPVVDHWGYVRIPGKVLLVLPSNRIVVGELAAE
jgi:hypothetical protein